VKPATQEQIDGWIAALVWYEQALLPHDHPRCPRWGGHARALARKRASAARSRLEQAGALPSDDEIRRRARDGVDMDAVRAQRAASVERHELLVALTDAAKDATADRLRAALTALLGGAS